MELQPGKEYPQPKEAEDIQEIISAILKRLERDYPPGKTLRQFHAKMHGCVKAVLKINEDIPRHFQYGFLIPGKEYEAWIRFSNGNTKVISDKKADLRGMAIKLLNIPGEMLEQDPVLPQSQDILLVTYPTLMSATVADFKKSIRAITGGPAALVLYALNPMNWPTLIRTLASLKKHVNLFGQQYWSVSPSRLGRENQAVKYSVIPSGKCKVIKRTGRTINFLRDVMKKQLMCSDFTFHFMIQVQQDPVKMPVEDPTVEWKSEWKKVATLTILQQEFNYAERDAFGAGLSFSPWHCLKEHQPLGGISRARREVYRVIAEFRLKRNIKPQSAQS